MKSVSAAIITLAGAVVFAGAPAYGKMMEFAAGVGGIIVAVMGLITWGKSLDPREPKP